MSTPVASAAPATASSGEEAVSGSAAGKSSAVDADAADRKSAPASAAAATPTLNTAATAAAAAADSSAGMNGPVTPAAAGSARAPCFFVEPIDPTQSKILEQFKARLRADGLYSLAIPEGFDLPADDKKGVVLKPKDATEAKRWAERQKNNYVPPPAAATTTPTAAAPAAAGAGGAFDTGGKTQYELELELNLIRFLRARKWEISAAYNQYKECLRWRRDEKIDGMLDVIDPLEDAYQAICPHTHHGWDTKGHPIYWEKTGYVHLPTLIKAVGEPGIIRRHVRYFEYVIRRMQHSSQKLGRNVSKQIVVFDLYNLSAKPDPTAIRVFKETLRIDSSYYPERLHQFFFINTPWYFRYSWAIVKPFLDVVTAAKFEVLSTDYHTRIQEFVAKEQIPLHYGGTCNRCTANPNGCIPALPKPWVRPLSDVDRQTLIVWDDIPANGVSGDLSAAPNTPSGGKPVGAVPKSPCMDPIPAAAKK